MDYLRIPTWEILFKGIRQFSHKMSLKHTYDAFPCLTEAASLDKRQCSRKICNTGGQFLEGEETQKDGA